MSVGVLHTAKTYGTFSNSAPFAGAFQPIRATQGRIGRILEADSAAPLASDAQGHPIVPKPALCERNLVRCLLYERRFSSSSLEPSPICVELILRVIKTREFNGSSYPKIVFVMMPMLIVTTNHSPTIVGCRVALLVGAHQINTRVIQADGLSITGKAEQSYRLAASMS